MINLTSATPTMSWGINCARGVSLCMRKMGSIYHFPRALPVSIWGHCSQVPVFTRVWGTHTKGCDNDMFHVLFSQHLVILGLPNTAKQGITQNDKSTLFCPPPPTGPPLMSANASDTVAVQYEIRSAAASHRCGVEGNCLS